MLSDWFKVTDLYLARNLCLLRVGENVHLRVDTPESAEIFSLLKCLDEELSKSKPSLGKRLRVMLSAALAPAIPLQIPAEVQRWDERLAILQASAHQVLASKANHITTQIEASGAPLGAAIAQETIYAITQWSEAHGLRLQSMQPIWSIASTAAALKTHTCKGVQINEADGSLLLVEQDGQWSQFYQGADMPLQARESVLRRIRIGLGLQEQEILAMKFGEKTDQPDDSLPIFWNTCWSKA
ncbi:MAG: hypothetical protein EBR49_17880, partial [Betaproteobacteria bacterium]|nr:hypothetical protein [Betaproteobacteria bacterium]